MLLDFILNLFVWLTIGYMALIIWARANPDGLMELRRQLRRKIEEYEEEERKQNEQNKKV